MTAAASDRAYRSLKGLEQTGATSRFLNLAAISARAKAHGGHEPEPPFFTSNVLGGGLIIKHRLRPGELRDFERPRYSATKLVVPFERTDLSLGGRSLFVGQKRWTQALGALRGEADADPRDAAILEALDELPSLDPFLVREQLKRKRIEVSHSYFVLSQADLERMHAFVGRELEQLVQLACGTARVRQETERFAHAILSGDDDLRIETLRGALHLESSEYGEGLFCWRGLLYYKWMLQELTPALDELLLTLRSVRLIGPRTAQTVETIRELSQQLASRLAQRTAQIAANVQEYDDAFALLRDQIDPAGFSRFLLHAPVLFQGLGEDAGLLSHISSYWRFRFGAPDAAAFPEELIELLEDFTSSLD